MWKKLTNKGGKRGSYLVEATMIMPIFILAVLMLLSAIPAFSASENAAFAVADELRLESAKAAFLEEPLTMEMRMEQRVNEENSKISDFRLKHVRYLYRKHKIDDLITVTYRFAYGGNDSQNLFQNATFEEKMTVRAFTGKLHEKAPSAVNGNTVETVYVFPNWGMRYHKKSCTYIKGSCEMVYLNGDIQKSYVSCKLCDAKSAQIGNPVFCFTKYGKVYHLGGCSTITKYYVTIDKGKALEQGYTPCTKCGG